MRVRPTGSPEDRYTRRKSERFPGCRKSLCVRWVTVSMGILLKEMLEAQFSQYDKEIDQSAARIRVELMIRFKIRDKKSSFRKEIY